MPIKSKIKSVIILLLTAITLIVVPAKAEAPHKEFTKEELQALSAYDDPQGYAKILLDKEGFSNKEFKCLVTLWENESHWNYKADNPNSTAYGIAQVLGEKSKEPATQISNGIRYIIHRYETPCNATAFWRKNYWY